MIHELPRATQTKYLKTIYTLPVAIQTTIGQLNSVDMHSLLRKTIDDSNLYHIKH